jgi:hypothetical protein
MTRAERLRRAVNWANVTTCPGFAVARIGGARPQRAPGGLYVAPGYRIGFPVAGAFTVGNVVCTRHDADYLLGDPSLLGHEARHATQYAWSGPLFWPAYGLAAAFSWAVSGHPAAYNPFEVWAGLAAGGYVRAPLRPWLSWAARRTAPRRAAASRRAARLSRGGPPAGRSAATGRCGASTRRRARRSS